MPRLDGTGPKGKGPKTGRGMGNCTTTTTKKSSTQKPVRRGMGRGNGRGQNGWPRGFGGN